MVTPHQLIREGVGDARTALLWDRAGGIVATGAMDAACDAGLRVHIVTPQFMVAEDTDTVQRIPLYERLLSNGAIFMPNADLVRIEAGEAVVQNVYSHEESRLGPFDLLIGWSGPAAMDNLMDAATNQGIEAHLAGDALSPRTADVAFAEGAMIAREI